MNPAGDAPPDPLRPYRLSAAALALALLFVAAAELASNFRHPIDRDFISFWAAAVLALDGRAAAAYDVAVHHAVQLKAASFKGLQPFPYPPAFLLLVLPFGLLSYPAAIIAWGAATGAGYLSAARRLFPSSSWLPAAFPPVFVNLVIGQNGLLTGGIFISGLALIVRRPFTAGLLMGCLIFKPQLGLLLPLAFVAGREWRAFAGASVSSLGVLLLGLAVFGLEASRGWIGQMPFYAAIARDGGVGWHKLASVYAALRQAGLAAGSALAFHIVVALLAAAMVWRIWRGRRDPGARGAALAAATVLISPYLYLYDAVILLVPFLWLAKARANRALLAALWCLPLFTIAQTYGFTGPVNLNPLVPIVLLALIYRASRARVDEGPLPDQQPAQ